VKADGETCQMNYLLEQLATASYRPRLEAVLGLCVEPGVSDVVANGADSWWRDRGDGLKPVPDFAVPEAEYEPIARFLVALAGRHVDSVNPIADGAISASVVPALALHDVARVRVHATLGGTVADRTLLSLRTHRLAVPSLDELCRSAGFGEQILSKLREVLATRTNFVICGAAGSGKTTLLRAMLGQDLQLRTIAVEDTAELLPVAGHVIGLEAKLPNSDGAGEIGLAELLRQALRMRPDRIVVGEVRGAEASVLLQAMNTGHPGSAATIHASSIRGAATRLQALLLQAGTPLAAAREQIRQANVIAILLNRDASGFRSIEIGCLSPEGATC